MKNLQKCFEHLYNKANHKIEKFGSLSIANGSCKSHDFNLIFNSELSSDLEYQEQLKEALDKVNNLSFPFLFVQNCDRKTGNNELLSNAGFSYIGRATCVSINHDNYIARNKDNAKH